MQENGIEVRIILRFSLGNLNTELRLSNIKVLIIDNLNIYVK